MRLLPRLLALSLAAAAGAHASTGRVFEVPGPRVPESGPPRGIAGVEVSNGRDVAVTDASGGYSLPDGPEGAFVIKPRGWALPDGPGHLAQMRPQGQSGDFQLTRAAEPDSLTMLVLTDTQPMDAEEVGYLEKGVIARIPRSTGAAFGVTLGDIVYDRPDLFGAVCAAVAKTGLPWFDIPGNHDLALGTPDEARAVVPFEAAVGPSTFAFHWGPALFLALDDVRPLGGPRYIGGLREEQFAFIENLVRRAAADEWVVLMMHIPIFPPDPSGAEGFRRADRARLFSLLRNRTRLLVLSGHTHYQRHVMHGASDGWEGARPLHEFNVAAACGGFWGGPRDADGIPASTMWDGTPPGYALIRLDGDTAATDYFPSRLPSDRQIGLHAPAVVAPGQGYVSFYANVYNGHEGWTIEARVDDRGWLALRNVLGWDPAYAEAYLLQDSSPRPSPGKRLPDPAVCYHLWRGALPSDLGVGRHLLQVRATDPGGRSFSAEKEFKVARP